MTTKHQATIEDLYKIEGKAELVNGEIELMPPTGDDPAYAGLEITISLRNFAKSTKQGRATGDNVGFAINLPGRKSFSPDAAFHNLPRSGMKFLQGAPLFAVEVRSENDYGKEAEKKIKKKIKDYFDAGTKIVWDVDLLGTDIIKSYDFNDPDNPRVFRKGEIANAEPFLPGWQFPVNDLFE